MSESTGEQAPKQPPTYEQQALRALQRARKSLAQNEAEAASEADFQLAAANIYATLELATALRRASGG